MTFITFVMCPDGMNIVANGELFHFLQLFGASKKKSRNKKKEHKKIRR